MPNAAPRRRRAAVAAASKAAPPEARRPARPKRPAAAPKPIVDGTPHVHPEGEFLWESSPSRYIARMSAATGREVLRPIDPDELLIQAHRDKNPVEVTASFLASRLVQVTGNEEKVRDAMKKVNELGTRLAERAGRLIGSKGVERRTKKLMGVVDREVFFQFREPTHLSEREVKARIAKLQEEAAARLKARGRSPRLRVLLTGATGFLGQEILAQAASDRPSSRCAPPRMLSVVATSRWSGPNTLSLMHRARSSGSQALSGRSDNIHAVPRLLRVAATRGWSGPNTRSLIRSARCSSGRAVIGRPSSFHAAPRHVRANATSGWLGPNACSLICSARSKSSRAASNFPRSPNTFPRLVSVIATSG